MKMLLARLMTCSLFLMVWIASFMIVQWLFSTFLLETRDIKLDNVPFNFHVVVEEPGVDGKKPTYQSIPYRSLSSLAQSAPQTSLRLSTSSYSDLDLPEVPSSCCMDFKVLDDGPNGQLIEHNNDDLSHLRSRYLVRGNEVIPVSFRSVFSLFYFIYFVLGCVIAIFATMPLRRRILAWARRGNLPASVSHVG